MDALDEPGVFALNSGTVSTAVFTTLSTAATNHSPNRFARNWLWVPSGTAAGQVRIVREDSFLPATGGVSLDPGWTVPNAGDEVEITALFPAVMADLATARVGRTTDYRTILNRALSRLLVPDRVTLAITTSRTYSLSTWAYWLDREERLVRVLEPSPVTGGLEFDARWRNPRLRLDGPTPTLTLDAPFATASGNLILEVLRPAHTFISAAESTTGYSTETDTAIPDQDSILTVGLWEAYRALRQRGATRPNGSYADLAEAQLEECRKLRFWDFSRDTQQASAQPAVGIA